MESHLLHLPAESLVMEHMLQSTQFYPRDSGHDNVYSFFKKQSSNCKLEMLTATEKDV